MYTITKYARTSAPLLARFAFLDSSAEIFNHQL